MAISTELSGLAMSLVSGALKLNRKLDAIMAEETALKASTSIPFPDVTLAPSIGNMRTTLIHFRNQAKKADPQGATPSEFTALDQALNTAPSDRDKLFRLCTKHGLIEFLGIETFSPDGAFEAALRDRNKAWNLADDDIRKLTYFLAAGPSRRQNNLSFRIGALVLDVLAEVAAQNTRLVIDHEPTRKLVETILTKFSKPDLEEMDGWGGVLEQALRVTLNTVIDEREAVAGNREWLERALSTLARARDEAPDGENFVVGLMRGTGFNELIRAALFEGSDYLSKEDGAVWESIVADVLVVAGKQVKKDGKDFGDYFQENWHMLVGAGFASLEEHGPKLLKDDDKILRASLTAAVGALAGSFSAGPPTGQTLSSAIQAGIAVFADTQLLEGKVKEDWFREMIASVAGTVGDKGLRAAFSQPALESYTRDTLEILSRYPELLAADNQLVQKMLTEMLGGMSTVDTFGVGPLADAAVEGALSAVAENSDLLGIKYPAAVGEIAAMLAQRVASGGIGSLQGEALIGIATEVLSENGKLFLQLRAGLAKVVVESVLKATKKADDEVDDELLKGAAVVAMVQMSLDVVAAKGLNLSTNLETVGKTLEALLKAGLEEASKQLGKGIAQTDVPAVMRALLEKLVSEVDIPNVTGAEFPKFFKSVVDEVLGQAA